MDNEAAINQTQLHLSLQDDKEEEEEEESDSWEEKKKSEMVFNTDSGSSSLIWNSPSDFHFVLCVDMNYLIDQSWGQWHWTHEFHSLGTSWLRCWKNENLLQKYVAQPIPHFKPNVALTTSLDVEGRSNWSTWLINTCTKSNNLSVLTSWCEKQIQVLRLVLPQWLHDNLICLNWEFKIQGEKRCVQGCLQPSAAVFSAPWKAGVTPRALPVSAQFCAQQGGLSVPLVLFSSVTLSQRRTFYFCSFRAAAKEPFICPQIAE